jgi:ADP-ribose pyrophosphatase
MTIKILETKELCKGKRIRLYMKKYQVDDRVVDGDAVEFGESVAILPIKDENKIVLLRQFRIPIGRWIYEIPAGRMEKGEDWRISANRELLEETGYIARKLEKICSIYMVPGYSDEIIHIIIAKNLIYKGVKPDEGEIIEIKEVTLEEAKNLIFRQEVGDAKSIIALSLYLMKRKEAI